MKVSAVSWPEIRIGDLGKVFTGRTPSSERPEYFGSEFPFVTPGDMRQGKYVRATERSLSAEGAELLRRIRVPANSVCVSCIGWQMGEVILTDQPSFTNQQINTIVPKNGVEPSFLSYALRPRKQEVLALGTMAGVRTPILNKSAFCELKVHLPPLAIQRHIAGILSAYDELIENSQRRIKILDAMARGVYREWFVHFRFPGHESVPRVHSPLGEIPKGWKVNTLEQLSEIRGGKQLEKCDIHEIGEFPVFGGNGIQGYSETATHRGFVIAFGRVGAYCGSIHWSYGGAWLNNNSSSVVPLRHDELVLQHLLHFNFINLRGGSAQPFISNTALAGIELLLPSDALATKFCSIVKPLRLQQVALDREIKNLRHTRDLLLPRLLSGQIEVGEVPE